MNEAPTRHLAGDPGAADSIGQARFAQVLIQANDMETLDIVRIQQTVANHGLACVRGLYSRDEVRNTLAQIRDRFDPTLDRKHDPSDSDAVRRNFQKLQIGANSGINSKRTLGRFMRAIYNPIFAEDALGMRENFIRLAQLRNRLYGKPVNYAVKSTDDGFWSCTRLLQYPSGGGFMVPHRDVYSQLATTSSGLGYYQLLMLMTERGTDFTDGGGYVDHDDHRFHYEAFTRSGDVVVYDGRSVHGVADIDPMADLDLAHFGGRIVALVSLFKLLDSHANEYAEMPKAGIDPFL